jgi:hypothetical protein
MALLFHLFTEITDLILKKDVVEQEQGAMAQFQLTETLQKGELSVCCFRT